MTAIQFSLNIKSTTKLTELCVTVKGIINNYTGVFIKLYTAGYKLFLAVC
jgi:hypothetical protein